MTPSKPLPPSLLPGYQAGYAAGRKYNSQNHAPRYLTPSQKEQIALGWLLEQRDQLRARIQEIESELDSLATVESLRGVGFVFPPGYLTNSTTHKP